MSLHRRNPRRDANELEIVDALEKVGALVARLSVAGLGDLLVCWPHELGYYRRGAAMVAYHQGLYLLEVKRPASKGVRAGKATKAQTAKAIQGWPSVRVENVAQALAAIGVQAR